MPNFDGEMVEWIVKAGDPAQKTVSLLRKKGIETIVLPRSVYLGRPVSEPLPTLSLEDPMLAFRVRELDCRILAEIA